MNDGILFVALVVSSSSSYLDFFSKFMLSLSELMNFPKILKPSLILLGLAGLGILFLADSVLVKWKSKRLLFFGFYLSYSENKIYFVL